jgi:hypothetical protein
MRDIFLLITSIATFFYTLRFGYLLTGYGHGGQILGIPFTLLLIVLAIIGGFITNVKMKKIVNILTIFLFLSIAIYSGITETIIRTNQNWFRILYLDNVGISDKIFKYTFIINFLLALFFIIKIVVTKYPEDV